MIANSTIKDTADSLNAFYPKGAISRTDKTLVKVFPNAVTMTVQDRTDYLVVDPTQDGWGTDFHVLYGSTKDFTYIIDYKYGVPPTTTATPTTTSAPTTTTTPTTTSTPTSTTTTAAPTSTTTTTANPDTGDY